MISNKPCRYKNTSLVPPHYIDQIFEKKKRDPRLIHLTGSRLDYLSVYCLCHARASRSGQRGDIVAVQYSMCFNAGRLQGFFSHLVHSLTDASINLTNKDQ